MNRNILFAGIVGVTALGLVAATDGVWTSTMSSLWSDAANWQDGQKPDGGTATLTARPLNDKLLLDENVTLSGWRNTAGASIYLDASSLPNSADRHGVVSASATFRLDNRSATSWGVPLTGLSTLVATNGSLFSFCWPQTFPGTIDQTQYSTLAVDYRYAAVSDAAEDTGLLRASTLMLAQGSRFRVYGRYPRAAITAPCRLTPGSPDLVFLEKNQSARAILSAGQHVSAPGLADGSYIRAISFGASENVITLDRVAQVESVTTQDVTFAAGAWTVRQRFDTLNVGGGHGYVNPVPAGDGTSIFAAQRLTGGGVLYVDPTTECSGTDGRIELGDTHNSMAPIAPSKQAQVIFTTCAFPDVGTPVLWMDASDAASVTVMDGAVTAWRDTRGGSDTPVATPWRTDTPPLYAPNAAAGRAVIDFGALGSHRAFVLDREVSGVRAAFIVLDSHESGGTLLGAKKGCSVSYKRGFDGELAIGATSANYRIKLRNGLVGENIEGNAYTALNGRRIEPTSTGLGGGWDVIAYSRPNVAKKVSAFALDEPNDASGDRFSGGQRLAEVLLYTNELTVTQCQAVEAYLMQKWGITDMTGPRRLIFNDATGCPTVGVAGETGTLHVWDGVQGTGPFAVKAGTRLEAISPASGLNPTLNAGATLSLSARRVPTAPNLDGAVLWIDASAPNAAVTNAAGEASEVHNLVPNALTPTLWPDKVPPMLTRDGDGRATFDFGDRDNGCCLRAFTNFMATSVFLVWEPRQYGCQPLGSLRQGYTDAAHPSTVSGAYRPNDYASGTVFDFFRNGWGGFITTRCSPTAQSGDWYRDGVYQVDVTNISVPTNTPMLYAGVMQGWGGRVSAIGGFGYDGTAARNIYTGGFRLSEMLIYNRRLSADERRDVEAYLTRKWFPSRALPAGYSVNGVFRLGTVKLNGDATLEATDSSVVLMAESVTGSGTLTLGNGTKLVAKSVADGVSFAEPQPGVTTQIGEEVASGAILHVDAARKESMTPLNQTWEYVKYWKDIENNITLQSGFSPEGWVPLYLAKGCNGLDVINFDTRAQWEATNNRYKPPRSFVWPNRMTNIRTVFWMWRDHPTIGGGWLLGDGQGTDVHPSDFTRGNLGMSGGNSAYFDATRASEYVLNGSLRCNGMLVSPTSVPKAGWQVLSLVTTGPCAADRVAADRACVNGNLATENMAHWGGMQLGEMLIYDRALSAEERMATENYLMKKWALGSLGGTNTTGVVMGGTTVTPHADGVEAYIYGMAGDGKLVFDGGTTTVCADEDTLDGCVELKRGATVVLRGTDYSTVDFHLASGTLLDLNGGTVYVRSVHGAGRVVNGELIGPRIGAGTCILFR